MATSELRPPAQFSRQDALLAYAAAIEVDVAFCEDDELALLIVDEVIGAGQRNVPHEDGRTAITRLRELRDDLDVALEYLEDQLDDRERGDTGSALRQNDGRVHYPTDPTEG